MFKVAELVPHTGYRYVSNGHGGWDHEEYPTHKAKLKYVSSRYRYARRGLGETTGTYVLSLKTRTYEAPERMLVFTDVPEVIEALYARADAGRATQEELAELNKIMEGGPRVLVQQR